MLPFQTVALLPLLRTCENVWSGWQGSALRGKAAFPAAPHGAPVFINLFP